MAVGLGWWLGSNQDKSVTLFFLKNQLSDKSQRTYGLEFWVVNKNIAGDFLLIFESK